MKFILPLDVSSFDGSVEERLATIRGNPRSIPARSKKYCFIESTLISLGNSQLQVITFKQPVLLAKMVQFGEVLKNLSLRSNIVTRKVNFNRTKIGGKCQNSIVTF